MANDDPVRETRGFEQQALHRTTWNYKIKTGTSSLMGEAKSLTQGVPRLLGKALPCSLEAPHLGIPKLGPMATPWLTATLQVIGLMTKPAVLQVAIA